ncbi:MAG: glycosyltransferase family 4 protein [Pseudomonadota bacterium]
MVAFRGQRAMGVDTLRLARQDESRHRRRSWLRVRIGVVTTSYPREPGDPAGGFVAGFARWLQRNGHLVEVIAAGPGAGIDAGVATRVESASGTGGVSHVESAQGGGSDGPRCNGSAARVGGPIIVHRINAGAGLFYEEGAPDRLQRSILAWTRVPVFSAAMLAALNRHAGRWDAVVSHWLVPSGLATALLVTDDRPHLAIAHSSDVHLAVRLGIGGLIVDLLSHRGARICFTGKHLLEELRASIAKNHCVAGDADGADTCSARSDVTGETRLALLQHSSFVCPVGIDTASFARLRRSAEDTVVARKTLGLPETIPIVGYLGRLVPIKGVHVLLEAMTQLGTSSAVVAVAGDGPERPVLARLAARPTLSTVFLGELRGAQKEAFLAAVDLLVVPSTNLAGGRTEGMPAVVLEALAAGVPLIASAVGGIAEVTANAAILVPPGDPQALALAIRRLLDDDLARAAMALAGRVAATAFDWERVGPRLLAALIDHSFPTHVVSPR